jgi:mRNA interferase HigB
VFPYLGTLGVDVYGEAAVARFARKHPASRKPLQRFLEIVKQANWPHFAAVKSTFAAADYVSGRLVFDIGGNKYRIVASVDFDGQILVVDKVMTHERYNREEI